MKNVPAFLLAATGLLLTTAQPYAQSKGYNRMLARAKQTPASQLDPALPAQRFDAWLDKAVGPGAKVEWELNDCGEQSGSIADIGRDIPICAQAEAALPDGRKVVIMYSIGTQKKGLSKKAGGIYYLAIESGAKTQELTGLQELAEAIRGRDQ